MLEIQASGATLRTRKHFYRPPFRASPFVSATKRSSEILSSRGVAGITGLPTYPRRGAHPARRSPRAVPSSGQSRQAAAPGPFKPWQTPLLLPGAVPRRPDRASLPAGPAYLSAPARPERAAAEQGGGGGAQQQPQQHGGGQQGGQRLQRVRPERQPHGPQAVPDSRHRTGPGRGQGMRGGPAARGPSAPRPRRGGRRPMAHGCGG